MLSSTRQAIACILIVAGAAVCGYPQTTPSNEPAASISGKVTLNGKGVPGVVVAVRSNEPMSFRKLTSFRGVTDAKGEYRIANVPAGNYVVMPAAAAFVADDEFNAERTLIVNKAETIENFDFSLKRGGVITGRVVDSDGRPVIEEEVQAFVSRDSRMASLAAVITDDRGVYRIFALKPGNYTVATGRDDMAGFSGRHRGAFYRRTYHPGTNDPAHATVIQVSEGSEATNVDITLSRTLTTHSASGRIVDGETGQPIPNVSYGVTRFITPTNTSSISVGALTNSRGEFKLENLVPGQYAVLIRSEPNRDWRAEEVRFEVVDQDVTGLVVRTLKGGSLSGVLLLEGTSDKAIREQFRSLNVIVFVSTESNRRSGTPGSMTTPGPDGAFRVGALPTGVASFSLGGSQRFRIARIERDGIVQLRGVEVKEDEHVAGVRIVVGYADASIRGTVEIENGTLPPNGRLFLWVKRLHDDPARSSWTNASQQMDTRGQFVINNLLAGTYELTAGVFVQGSRAPLAQKKQEVEVTAASTSNVTIKLDLNAPAPKP